MEQEENFEENYDYDNQNAQKSTINYLDEMADTEVLKVAEEVEVL